MRKSGVSHRAFLVDADGERAWQTTGAVVVLAAVAVYVVGDVGHTYDDPYILMRYARNLVHGHGWTLAPDETTPNIATSTGYVLVLAALARAGLTLPAATTVAFAAGVVATAWFTLASRPDARGVVTVGLIVSSPQLIAVRGMETWLLLGLVSASCWALQSDRQRTAGSLVVAAFLIRPDAALLVATLTGWHRFARGRWPRAFVVIAVVGISLAALTVVTTVGFPTTLAAKRAQGGAPWWPRFGEDLGTVVAGAPVWWSLAIAGLALNRTWRDQPALWCAAGFAVAYMLLGVASYPWYYAIPTFGVATAAGTGLGRVSPRGALVLAATAALSVPTSLPPQRLEMATAGRWLREVAPPGSTLGASEIGIVGWYSDLSMRSYLGLLDPGRAEVLGTPRMTDWVHEDRPDYLLVTFWAPDRATAAAAADHYTPVWTGDHVQVWERTDTGPSTGTAE